MLNKFCKLSDLSNEATVEARFVDKLLDDLGFTASEIKLKTSLQELKVGKGSKSALYKPDYVVLSSRLPTLVVDAKSTTENIKDFEQQCSSYCLEINKGYDHNPVKYYMLSNGIKTALYEWDSKKPLVELDFEDFVPKNPRYLKLCKLIGKVGLAHVAQEQLDLKGGATFEFKKLSLEELGVLFQRMHQYI